MLATALLLRRKLNKNEFPFSQCFMKVLLFKYKWIRVKRALSLAVLAVFVAIATTSCGKKNDVLVTEIGVSPPNRGTAKDSQSAQLYIQGLNMHVKGDSQGAIAAYTKAISLNPKYAAAYNSRGVAYFD